MGNDDYTRAREQESKRAREQESKREREFERERERLKEESAASTKMDLDSEPATNRKQLQDLICNEAKQQNKALYTKLD